MNPNLRMPCLVLCTIVLSMAGRQARADFDVSPAVTGGKIITDAFEDPTNTLVHNVKVFGAYGLNSDPTNPFFTEDPGFHPQPGTGFVEGSKVTVVALSG